MGCNRFLNVAAVALLAAVGCGGDDNVSQSDELPETLVTEYSESEMDAAMEAAERLSWSKGDAARVTFLVADAPPHANKFDDTLDAVDGLRERGVAVYPVASSGVAGEAEFVMRSAAMLPGV